MLGLHVESLSERGMAGTAPLSFPHRIERLHTVNNNAQCAITLAPHYPGLLVAHYTDSLGAQS
jgi:hypothetical protein